MTIITVLTVAGLGLAGLAVGFNWHPAPGIGVPATAFLALVARVVPKALKMAERIIPVVTWVADTVAQPSEATQGQYSAAQARLRDATARLEDASRRLTQVEEAFKEAKSPKGFAELVRTRIASGQYEQRLGIISAVRRDLEQLQESMEAAKEVQTGDLNGAAPYVDRIVLYIDDLDRCPPDKVVDVLEAVHLLLDFKLFVVVVGVDSRWVTRCLIEHYPLTLSDEHGNLPGRYAVTLSGDGVLAGTLEGAVQHKANGTAGDGGQIEELATPHDYLEKIFQVPYWLPPMNRKGSAKLLDKLAGTPVSRADSLSDMDRLVDEQVRREQEEADAAKNFAKESDKLREMLSRSQSVPLDNDGEEEETKDGHAIKAGPPVVLRTPEEAAVVKARVKAEKALEISRNETAKAAKALADATASEVPTSLAFTPKELDYLRGLAPYAGDSPRRLKRFLNMYRYIRATLSDELAVGFMVDEGESGSYKAMAAVLALVTGAPDKAPEVFERLFDIAPPSDLEPFFRDMESMIEPPTVNGGEWQTVAFIFDYYRREAKPINVGDLTPWIHRVARFTFRTGRTF